ncbi:MAG: hypothetical protein KAI47_06110, partial [Deltaproteobacteria bacterium]|nr:hypothetical protein [Deltaproteobacteria bacterium]
TRLTKMSLKHAIHSGKHESPEHIAHHVTRQAQGTLDKLFGPEHSAHIKSEISMLIVSTLLHAVH